MKNMKTFLLIGQSPIKINGLTVGDEQRLFYDMLSPLLDTTLVYPRHATHKTFCAAVVRDNGRITLSVCNPDSHSHFDNTDFPNLLFFKHSIEAETLRLVYPNPGGGQTLIATYHAVTSVRGQAILDIKQIDFGGNENLWQQYSALSRHLFIQEFDQAYQVDPDISHDLNVQSVFESLPDTEDVVWVNPVCLRLPLTGAELKSTQFDLWAEETEPLWLEPLFQAAQAPRIHFYQYGDKQIKARLASNLSRIEQLIWGTPSFSQAPYPRWQAFAALDVLQGRFFLKNQSNYFWLAPDNFSPNADYFADYWLTRWHGQKATDDSLCNDSKMIKSPSYTKTFRYAANSLGMPLNNEAYHDRETLFQCFSLLKKPVFKVIQAVLSHCPEDHVANDLHRGYLTVHENQDEYYALAFNAQAYLYEFALRYIVPFSQIMIELPAPDFLTKSALDLRETQQASYNETIKNLYFNPIDSTFHGARGFFQQLSVSLETGLQTEPVTQTLKLGWWNHWHEYLYQNATQSHFKFNLSQAAQQKTCVGQAKVGNMTYVGGYTLYQPTQKMCL